MKTTKIITLATLVTIMLFSINSYSQRGGMGKGIQNRPTFESFDLNNDSFITASEFNEIRSERQNQNAKNGGVMQNRANAPSLENIDLDNDGKVSKDEFAKHQVNRFNNNRGVQLTTY
jgi:Ca2+-binding EF-hand superfamily protein